MATNFFELATTLKNLGAKWLSEKKVNFTPCASHSKRKKGEKQTTWIYSNSSCIDFLSFQYITKTIILKKQNCDCKKSDNLTRTEQNL